MSVQSSRRHGSDGAAASPLAILAMSGLLAMLLATPAAAVTVELKDVAPDRIERQIAAAEGRLPLAGAPDIGHFQDRLAEKGLKLGQPMLVRVFKAESELEVWMEKGGRFELFATYPVCQWSGTIGPKVQVGDKQTPEGFYTVTRRQLHRSARHPRSLNLGFPNPLDRANSRTGDYILVHGGCASVGCFAMTDTLVEEIYALTQAAIRAGQHHVPVHVFPFRMTEANLAERRDSEWREFWENLKEGYDAFEASRLPPRVSVCDKRYVFRTPAPGEGAEPGPLAGCGEKIAAPRTKLAASNAAASPPPPLPIRKPRLLPTATTSLHQSAAVPAESLSAAELPAAAPQAPDPVATPHQPSDWSPATRCSEARAECGAGRLVGDVRAAQSRAPDGRMSLGAR